MADIKKLSQIADGVNRNVDIEANSLVTTSVKVGGATNTELTKTLLDKLVLMEALTDAAGKYTAADVKVAATATNYTAGTADVEAHLVGIDTALASAGGVEFDDSTFRVQDNADATKEIAFEASSVATGTTRTITMPDTDVDLGQLANLQLSNLTGSVAIPDSVDILPANANGINIGSITKSILNTYSSTLNTKDMNIFSGSFGSAHVGSINPTNWSDNKDYLQVSALDVDRGVMIDTADAPAASNDDTGDIRLRTGDKDGTGDRGTIYLDTKVVIPANTNSYLGQPGLLADRWAGISAINLYSFKFFQTNNVGTQVFSIDNLGGVAIDTTIKATVAAGKITIDADANDVLLATQPTGTVDLAVASTKYVDDSITGSAGANTTLSNLGTTNINANLLFNGYKSIGHSSNALGGLFVKDATFYDGTTSKINLRGATISQGETSLSGSGLDGQEGTSIVVFTKTKNNATTKNIGISTGQMNGSGAAFGSGLLTLRSGEVRGSVASGAVKLYSGDNYQGAGGSGNTGKVTVQSGDVTGGGTGSSGDLDLLTGSANQSSLRGNINLDGWLINIKSVTNFTQQTTPTDDPSAGFNKLYFKSDDNLYRLDSAGNENLVGEAVTSATVNAAGATMNTDTDVSANGWVIDEDSMVSNSATKVPTQQSVKAYVDAAVASEVTYKGGYDASTNTPDLDSTPIVTAVGDMYTVTAAGVFFSANVEIGDVLIAEIVNATVEADWTIIQKNLDAASIKTSYESNSNTNAYTDAEQTKVSSLSGTNTGDEVAASTAVAGIVELATLAEVNTGTDTDRAVTPASLATIAGNVTTNNGKVGYVAATALADVVDDAIVDGEANAPSQNAVFDALAGKADVSHDHNRIIKDFTAGESFAANTSFMVRIALTGETAGRVYKADKDASSSDKFYAIGFIEGNGATAKSAGDSVSIVLLGEITLGSSDTNFAAGEIGQAVHVLATGAFDAVSQITYAADEASFRGGIVLETSKILVGNMQLLGIN